MPQPTQQLDAPNSPGIVPGAPQAQKQDPYDFSDQDPLYVPLSPLEGRNMNEQPPQEEPPPANVTVPQEDDPEKRRFQYWQSKHDKLQKQMETVQPLLPLVQALQSRPDLMQQLAAPPAAQFVVPSNFQQPSPPPALQQPVPPKKPIHYDPNEAYTNPESESFRYRVELDDYRDQRIQYIEKREEMRAMAMEESLQAMAAERQREEVFNQTRSNLARMGIVGQDAEDFISWSSNPQIDLNDLVDVYRMRTGMSPANPQIPQSPQAQQLRQRAQQTITQLQVPPSLVSAGGEGPETPPQLTDSQRMTAAFINAGKRSSY